MMISKSLQYFAGAFPLISGGHKVDTIKSNLQQRLVTVTVYLMFLLKGSIFFKKTISVTDGAWIQYNARYPREAPLEAGNHSLPAGNFFFSKFIRVPQWVRGIM